MSPTPPILALAALLAAPLASAQTAFEKPVAEQIMAATTPGRGNEPPVALTIHCATYARFMVRDVREGQDIGTAAVGIAPPGAAPCGAAKPLAIKDLPGFANMDVVGGIGPFLILMWPDGFNGGTPFGVFDAVVGRKLYTDSFQYNPGFKHVALAPGADTLELRFIRLLTLPCSVLSGGAACWTRSARDLKFPPEIARRPAPIKQCAEAYAAATDPTNTPANPNVITYEVDMTIAASGAIAVKSRGPFACTPSS